MKRAADTATLVVVCLASVIQAEPIRQPPSLEARDQYRLAFVTTTTTTAESSDIETYNAFVQAAADAALIGEWGLEWKAIAGTETVSARENTGTDPESDGSVPIFLLDGTELVPSYAALWNAGTDFVLRSFDINESGEPFSFDDSPVIAVWTGTGIDGLPFFSPGPNRAGPLGAGEHPIIGFGDADSSLWFSATNRPRDWELRLYAISNVLTAVPEPWSSAHAFIILSSLLNLRKSRRYVSLPWSLTSRNSSGTTRRD